MFEEGETKRKKTKEGKESEWATGDGERLSSPASAFWTAACWMIGLKRLFNVTSALDFDINTPRTPPPREVTLYTTRGM